MNYKNRLKAFIFALLCMAINSSKASTDKGKLPTDEEKKRGAIVLSTLGLGTAALYAAEKNDLIDRYLTWRGAENWSYPRGMLEVQAHGLGALGLALGTSALAFWGARKAYLASKAAYQSKRASSLRERFWNWYNRKPTEPLKKLTTEKPTIN